MIYSKRILYGFIWILIIFAGCENIEAKQKPGKKIFYINSYHCGYPPSDEVMEGLKGVTDTAGAELITFFLDTKNNADSKMIDNKVKEALQQIKEIKPNVLIVSDDAAMKYVVQPWLQDISIPVIYCGVNWSDAQYKLPADKITGMLEVLPLRQNLQTMKSYYPEARRLVVLSENSLSEERNKEILDTLYRNLGFSVQYDNVNDFTEWKEKFRAANEDADMIYLPTNGAIKEWNKDEAEAFVKAHIKKPVITCDDFMMPYCVYGLTKVAREQGIWAGKTAMAILSGRAIKTIPKTVNKETRSYINRGLATKIGFAPGPELMGRSQIIN